MVRPPTESNNHIYEYDNFSPIPVQTGDILGVFIPRTVFHLLSENTNAPTNYYRFIESQTIAPFDMIDLRDTRVLPEVYHPLATADIGM